MATMTMNEGSRIVPLVEVNAILLAASRPGVVLPNDYKRVQLLTEDAIRDLVFKFYDRTYLGYGTLSPDFPLCMDFANICSADVLRGAVKAGLAVRPGFGVAIYTKNSGSRHAINYAATVDRRVFYFEPQLSLWLAEPDDCGTMDEFKL